MGREQHRSRYNNKAIYTDYNLIEQAGTDESYYKLTDAQRDILLTNTKYIGWRSRWENLPQADIARDYQDAIENALLDPKECMQDDDNNTDTDIGLVDGIIQNLKEGGISQAGGYLIEAVGRIVVETALKTIAITVIGIATSGTLSIVLGGSEIANVAIGINEVVTPIITLPNNPTNIIEFIFDAIA